MSVGGKRGWSGELRRRGCAGPTATQPGGRMCPNPRDRVFLGRCSRGRVPSVVGSIEFSQAFWSLQGRYRPAVHVYKTRQKKTQQTNMYKINGTRVDASPSRHYSNRAGFLARLIGRFCRISTGSSTAGGSATGGSVSDDPISVHARHRFNLSAWTTCSVPLPETGRTRKFTGPVRAVISYGPVYRLSHL